MTYINKNVLAFINCVPYHLIGRLLWDTAIIKISEYHYDILH